MRPVREITVAEENRRMVPFVGTNMVTSKCDGIEPEPVGTIVLMAFRITGYDPDCDGSLMARVENIDRAGESTGWESNSHGLYHNVDIVITAEEWRAMFESAP